MIPAIFGQRIGRWYACSGILVLCFSLTLIQLIRFCLDVDLFSYVLLVPAISGWLIWQQRSELRFEFRPAAGRAAGLGILALLAVFWSFAIDGSTGEGIANKLSMRVFGFVAAWNAVTVWTLGGQVFRQINFPAAFLIFLVPVPPHWVELAETGLQHASAVVAGWFFTWTGASFLQSGLVFQLPNITIQVAPECSGIRSTLVLFMTSLIAGHLFLERNWQRTLFTALVIPLGIARNAFRIVTIGWLCTEFGPGMIDSPIHHKGGPLFFAISLVPLFGLLFLFRWMNRHPRPNHSKEDQPAPHPAPAAGP